MTPPARSRSAVAASRRRTFLVVGAVAVLFLIVVLVAQLTQKSPATEDAATDQPAATAGTGTGSADSAGSGTDTAVVHRDPADTMAIGDLDAPVVLVEWTDMRCPFCAVFSRDVLPTLTEEYVETGRVRIEVRDVAYFGDQSEEAAVAVRAAGEQGLALEFMSAVYADAPEGEHMDLPRETLIAYAEQVGVPDIEQFTADLDDPGLIAASEASNTAASQLGITGVPYFVAGSSAISGAQSVEVFRAFLDDALAQAE